MKATHHSWAVKWESKNALDGQRTALMGDLQLERPQAVWGYPVVLFRTRKEAREYIKQRYGYIAERTDLQAEPHGWRMPKAVRVAVAVREIIR